MNKSRKFISLVFIVSICLVIGCKHDKQTNVDQGAGDKISKEDKKVYKRDKTIALIDQVDVDNPEFRAKIPKDKFSSTPVFLGTRSHDSKVEDIKMKLFMWEDKMRGYYQTFNGKTNIQVFGYLDGNNIALKSKNSDMPQESDASMTGTLIGDKLDLVFKKGVVGEDAIIKMELTDVEYPLLFYRTEDLEFYGNRNR